MKVTYYTSAQCHLSYLLCAAVQEHILKVNDRRLCKTLPCFHEFAVTFMVLISFGLSINQ